MLRVKLTDTTHHVGKVVKLQLLQDGIDASVDEKSFNGKEWTEYGIHCKNVGTEIFSFKGKDNEDVSVNHGAEFTLNATAFLYNKLASYKEGNGIFIKVQKNGKWIYDVGSIDSLPSADKNVENYPDVKNGTAGSFETSSDSYQTDRDAYWENKESNKTADIHRQVAMKLVAPTMPVKDKLSLTDYMELEERFWAVLGIMEGQILNADTESTETFHKAMNRTKENHGCLVHKPEPAKEKEDALPF